MEIISNNHNEILKGRKEKKIQSNFPEKLRRKRVIYQKKKKKKEDKAKQGIPGGHSGIGEGKEKG